MGKELPLQPLLVHLFRESLCTEVDVLGKNWQLSRDDFQGGGLNDRKVGMVNNRKKGKTAPTISKVHDQTVLITLP